MCIINCKTSKSQSAMEYLMTYGWSILIIAVVLGVLFQLGVFSGTNLVPKAQPGGCRIFRSGAVTSLQGICSGQLPQYSVQLNGNNAKVSLPNYNYGWGGSGITVSTWAKLASDPIAKANLFSTTTSGCVVASNGMAVNIGAYGSASSKLDAVLFDGSIAVSDRASTGTLSQASWKLVDVVWYSTGASSSNVLIYLNGALDASYAVAGAFPGSFSATAAMGGVPTCWGSASNTFLASNLQIYNASLDANQINALYLEGIGGAPIDPYHVIGWWPLNGNTNDYSGNGNNGAPSGIAYISS